MSYRQGRRRPLDDQGGGRKAQDTTMTFVRALILAALGLMLAACECAPTFDASSLPAYQRSLSVINAQLSVGDRHRLQLALLTLAAGEGSYYTAFAMANPRAIENIEALDGVPDPLILLDRMRPRIGGRTAAAVIRTVADDLDFAISRAEAQTGAARKALGALVIENARFYWDRGKYRNQPTAQFSIFNGSRDAVFTVFLSGVLTAPGLKTPLAMGGLRYEFARPLQPGAAQQVTVNLGAPGTWTAKQLDGVYDADLALRVANVSDANGRRLLAVSTDVLDTMRKKRYELRGG
jgi:CheY-like chemotaxis protein